MNKSGDGAGGIQPPQDRNEQDGIAEHPVPASTSANNAQHNNNEIERKLSSLESYLSSLIKLGSLEEAELTSKAILNLSQAVSPMDSPRHLCRKMNVAGILQMRSQFEQAEILQAETLTEMKASLGKDHSLTVQCTMNQAETLASRGRTEEAVSLLQNTLNTLPVRHEQSTAVKSGLAVKLVAVDRLEDAKTLLVEVMNIQRKNLPPMHPDILCTVAKLAGVYLQQGEWKLSEQTANSVLPAMKKTLGTQHPHTMSCMRHLALALQSRGQYQKAETHFIELMKCHDKIHGKENLETFKYMSEIASLYKDMGRYGEAQDLQESAINGLKDTVGEDHLETIDAENGMIMLYIALGKYKDAVALGERLARRTESILGPQHPSPTGLDSMQNLALAYNHQGRFQDAEALEQRVLEGWTARLGESHPSAITARCNLALTRFDLGKKEDAMKLLALDQDNVSIFPRNSDPATLQRLLNFAGVLCEDGFHDRAIPLAGYVFEARKEKFGNDHPETLLAMSNLAMAYHKNHNNEKAFELLTESTSMASRLHGEKHPVTLINLLNLALVRLERGETDLAEVICKNIVDDLKHKLGSEHKTFIECEKVLRILREANE